MITFDKRGTGLSDRTSSVPTLDERMDDMRAVMDTVQAIDVRAILPAISVPTLVVHCTGDPAVPATLGRYLADHLPGARYMDLPFDDHLTIRDGDHGVSTTSRSSSPEPGPSPSSILC